jgi:hypothetical protein
VADPGAIAGAEIALKTGDIVIERVEQARLFSERGAALGDAAAFTEQERERG